MDSGDDMPMSKYSDEYFEALDLYRSGLFEESIEAAEDNLANPTLPHYHQMENLILIVTVLEDWGEADRFLHQAEAIYAEANMRTSHDNEEAQSRLREVREDLDLLRQSMDEDAQAALDKSEDDDIELGEEEKENLGIQIMFQRLNVMLVRMSMSSPESKPRMQKMRRRRQRYDVRPPCSCQALTYRSPQPRRHAASATNN